MAFALSKTKRDPLIHVVRKQNISPVTKWTIRVIAILTGFVVCGLISCAMGGTFTSFFEKMFNASFGWVNSKGVVSFTKLWDLLERTGVLLLIAIALVPAFKMKFWNIGAEGQVLIGVLLCTVLQYYLAPKLDLSNGAISFAFFLICILVAIVGGAIWGMIPAFFKAKFKTNETLFTLMMNYVATFLTTICISVWSPKHNKMSLFPQSYYFPKIGGIQTLLNLIIIVLVLAVMIIYLRYTKHGYEISVVGESVNTAKYVGINVNKVIIRTMALSGGLCGLAGALILLGERNALSSTIVAGRGFTAVMIAWLGSLNPAEILLYSFLCAFIMKGSRSVSTSESFPNIMVAVFFFILIAFEFFANYELKSEKIAKFFSPITEFFKKVGKAIASFFAKLFKKEAK